MVCEGWQDTEVTSSKISQQIMELWDYMEKVRWVARDNLERSQNWQTELYDKQMKM